MHETIKLPVGILLKGATQFNELDMPTIYPIAQRCFGRDFRSLHIDGIVVRNRDYAHPRRSKMPKSKAGNRIRHFRAHFVKAQPTNETSINLTPLSTQPPLNLPVTRKEANHVGRSS